MKPQSLIRRRREIFYRIANTMLLRLLRRLYRWYGLLGVFHVAAGDVHYEVEGIILEFYFEEYGCTGNADANGLGEDHTRDWLFKLLPKGGVLYDIGAHEGSYTLTAAVRRPDVIVHSFEPFPERLRRHLRLNGLAQNRVHGVALGSESGTVRMVAGERSKNHVACDETGECEVPLVRLDAYVADHELEPPDFIKIDIEGMESAALRGAERLLREHQPVVICEINNNHARYGVVLGDFLAYMDDLGYDICRYWAGRMTRIDMARLGSVTLEQLGKTAYQNFWFIPRSREIPFPGLRIESEVLPGRRSEDAVRQL